MLKEEDMLNGVLAELGDISGCTVLDMGSGPCSMAVCLAKKIGDGRVFAVDLYTGVMDRLKEALTEDRLLRTIVVKADLRRLDFLRDDFVDLVTAFDTLSVVELYTPGGTPYVLNEARRILKPGGWFVALEHRPVESIRPIDKAEEVEIRWWKVHMDIQKALKETVGVEYTPEELIKTLEEAGFLISHWREMERGDVEQGMTFGTKMTGKAKKIVDKNLREKILKEMKGIEDAGLKYGMREFPRYVIYARNPARKPLKVLKPLSLRELYQTVHHRDLLF